MSDQAVLGKPFRGTERPSRSFAKGRVCPAAGCATKLSIYNGGRFCSEHEPMAVPRTRGRKIA
ncbi:MAG: hypothetical protein ABIW46_09070 [Acidimicrobiales bacterium]